MKITIRPEFKHLPPNVPAQLHVITRFSAQIPEEAALARTPLSIAFVIDRSGSMSGEKLEKTKQAISDMVRVLTRRDRITLVTFDTEVQHPIPLVYLRDKPAVLDSIEALTTGSSTNLSGGWLKGLTEIHENYDAGHISRVILLTDGQANHGITDREKLAAIARSFREKGVSTSTFGFGSDFNENLLKEIAAYGGGNFYYISEPEDAATSFRAEFGDLQHVAGQNCEIGFQFPPGVRLIEDFSHYPNAETQNGIKFFPGDLLVGVDGQIVLRLEIDKEFCEGKKDLFTYDFTYSSTTGSFDLIKDRAGFPFTFREGSPQLFLDDEVQDEIILAKTAKAKLIAAEEAGKGNTGKAIDVLNDREKIIRARLNSGKSFQSEILKVELDLLNRLKNVIAANQENLGKTIQSQVEEYVKKRGAYILGRKEKKYIFSKFLPSWSKSERMEFLTETRARLTDLGLEHDFLNRCLFCLVELMANAIEHGCKGKPDGEIQVKGSFRRGGCVIQFFDPGEGFAVDEALEKARTRLPKDVPSDVIGEQVDFSDPYKQRDKDRGRGLALILALGGDLSFTDGGREAMVRLQNKVSDGVLTFDTVSVSPGRRKGSGVAVRNHSWRGRTIPELIFDEESTLLDGRGFNEAAASCQQKGVLECILNLEKVRLLNSIAISALMGLISDIVEAGGRVTIVITSSTVHKCLAMVGVGHVAHFAANLNEALAYFPESGP